MSSIRSIILIIVLLYTIDTCQGKPTNQSANHFKSYVKYLLTILGTENEYTRFLSFMKVNPPEDVKMKALYNDFFSFDAYITDLIDVYAKYYTTDEIIQLINFYSTSLGKKHLQINQELNRQMEDTMLTKISDYIFTSTEHGFEIPLP